MARGRKFQWHDALGNITLLNNSRGGMRVLRGVLGLGLPVFALDKEDLPDQDRFLIRGVRASGRQIFLPLEVWATTRQEFLRIKQDLAFRLDPQRGPGYLYITDAGATYRVCATYAGGLEGDESDGVSWEEGQGSAVKTSITLDCISPFFELISPSIIGPYGNSGGIPFFPILPMRLNSSQILSDASQSATMNKITNPSFELNSTAGWSGAFFDSPIVLGTPTSVQAGDGLFSCRLDFPPAVNGDSGTWYTPGDGELLVAGQKYTAKSRIWVPSGQPNIQVGTWDGAVTNTKFDQWEWVPVTFNANYSINPILTLSQSPRSAISNVHGGYCYIDQAMLVEGPDTDYIDGTQPNCHWNGTPHASTSYRDPVYAPTNINNPGTKASYPIFKITGQGTQLDLFNRTLDTHVKLTYSIPENRVVTVDMANRQVTLDDGTNLYRYLDEDDFWGFEPGDNLVSLSLVGSAPGSMISGNFYPRFTALV